MILLKRLEFEGVGPYRKKQELRLGPGVTVIEGKNGHGKTRLFRALRLALYGDMGEGISLDEEINTYNRAHGNASLRTVLEFDFSAQGQTREVRVTRHFETDGDLQTLVEVDGNALSPEDGLDLLARLFPPNLASFYFFEAERLKEYEAAVEGGARADAVARTIERLVGIVAVEHAISDTHAAAAEATERITKAQDQNKHIQELQEKHGLLQQQLFSHQELLRSAERRRSEAIAVIDEVEKHLAEFDHFRELLARRTEFEARRSEYARAESEARNALNSLGEHAWIGVVEEVLRERRNEIRHEFEQIAFDLGSRHVFERQRAHLETQSTCPTCSTLLSEDERASTLGRLQLQAGTATSIPELERRLSRLSSTLSSIENALDQSPSGQVRHLAKQISRARADGRDAQIEIDQIQQEIQQTGLTYDTLKELVDKQAKAEQQAKLEARNIEHEEERISELRQQISRFEKQIASSAGTEVKAEDKAASIGARLLNEVFEDALKLARSMIQHEIQAKAEMFFLQVAGDRGYGGLRLDPSYRVTVLSDEGEPVPGLSSGYKQLVVLSLASALMRTTPVAGPVVMDMPFGRLDPDRAAEVLKALPLLSEQVVIFIFPQEGGSETLKHLARDIYAVYDIRSLRLDDASVFRRRTHLSEEPT